MTGPVEADLEAEYDRLTALIQSVSATPKASYMIDGVRFGWTEYLAELRRQRKDAMELLQSVPYVGETICDFPDE